MIGFSRSKIYAHDCGERKVSHTFAERDNLSGLFSLVGQQLANEEEKATLINLTRKLSRSTRVRAKNVKYSPID